ncbi:MULTISPECIES: DUF4328 domain-containing protein [Myroides]|uniref:DUF4328 domain-containing protein n=1 Tax=Myroides albus TaxID=2562892 RepID=A0A6I3LLN5_9FLAO|nr:MULTISPECIES: DUF4328 domain-containing protein [Myroides]MTG98764.1 DUF4328 domain-containing protein [Myroides albus]MVX35893.1 DUF4328 domain-containing protein [Myroides sp. LoEW2-1]UVD79919.1 DUF4328 domain-containing protein [Myroides albus]
MDKITHRINQLVKFSSFLLLVDVYALLNFTIMDSIVVSNVLKGIHYKRSDLVHLETISVYLNQFHLVVGVFFVVTFLAWFFNAFKNLQKLDTVFYESKYWTILAWIVPVFNLFLPFTILAKMCRRSYLYLRKNQISYGKKYPFSLFVLWWFIYVVFILINLFRNVLLMYGGFKFLSDLNVYMHLLNFIGVLICFNFVRHFIRLQCLMSSVLPENEEIAE